jgi:arylsulfatase A-like enzyme
MWRRIADSPWLYFGGAGVLLILAIASQFDVSLPPRDRGSVADLAKLHDRGDLNLVFILIDTLRADRLGAYGYERATSPNIDALARGGILFQNVISQSSWTKTSMASLWTATHPVRHGILRFNHVLPPEVRTPPEILKDAGFRTVGMWRNGWIAPNFGFDQGYDIYFKPRVSETALRVQRRNPGAHALSGSDQDIASSTEEFLRNFGNDRFFLYVHMMDLHQYVFDESATDFGPSYSDAYDRSIHWSDRVVGGLLAHLESHDLLRKTIVVVASDHGEAFREHGHEGHAKNLYREVTHVPFVIGLPFLLDPGIEVEEAIPNIDVWPTILDLLGVEPMKGVDGVSQVPSILAAADPGAPDGEARPIFSQLDRRWGHRRFEPDPLVSVTDDSLRLFLPVRRPQRAELYDHAADPGETKNLAEERPEEVTRLRAIADAYLERNESPWGSQPAEVELDEMQLGQLRALGYVVK